MSGISELADRALKDAKMNKLDGKEVFRTLLSQHSEVNQEYQSKLYENGLAQEMSMAAHRTRTTARTKTVAATGTGPSVIHLSFALRENMLDSWAMACNKSLGDCTMDDLEGDALAEEKSARGHAIKAKFYWAIRKGMKRKGFNPSVEPARDGWTEARIRMLFEGMFTD